MEEKEKWHWFKKGFEESDDMDFNGTHLIDSEINDEGMYNSLLKMLKKRFASIVNEGDKMNEIEKIKDCLNADKVLVAATRSSRCYSLRQKIEAAFERSAGSGEEVGDKEYIGRTLDVGGLDLYVDQEGDLWAGDYQWVRPIALED
ncbi:MAG: hypothetical protein ACOC8Y_05895 [Candidatus Natronoplasma sp.]